MLAARTVSPTRSCDHLSCFWLGKGSQNRKKHNNKHFQISGLEIFGRGNGHGNGGKTKAPTQPPGERVEALLKREFCIRAPVSGLDHDPRGHRFSTQAGASEPAASVCARPSGLVAAVSAPAGQIAVAASALTGLAAVDGAGRLVAAAPAAWNCYALRHDSAVRGWSAERRCDYSPRCVVRHRGRIWARALPAATSWEPDTVHPLAGLRLRCVR